MGDNTLAINGIQLNYFHADTTNNEAMVSVVSQNSWMGRADGVDCYSLSFIGACPMKDVPDLRLLKLLRGRFPKLLRAFRHTVNRHCDMHVRDAV